MCGRYSITAGVKQIRDRFNIDSIQGELLLPRYNIAPTQGSPVVGEENGKRVLMQFRWGLIPSWAKDAAIGNRMINARAETLKEKPAFRKLVKSQRCLAIADGFYEWAGTGLKRVPMRIVRKDNELFAFAALWDSWKELVTGNEIRSFTILTTSSEKNRTMMSLHHRMPVILDVDQESIWLSPFLHPEGLLERIVESAAVAQLKAYEVSKVVNSASNDSPECVEDKTA